MAKTRSYWQPDVVGAVEGFDRTLTASDFEPYQNWMSELLQSNEAVLLGAFMGSGKTAVALHAAAKLKAEGRAQKILIVAPMAVARDTWPDEIMVWDFARGFTYSVVVGDEPTRLAALNRDADVYVINRENYAWMCKKLSGRPWPFDTLIYDEASRLKAGSQYTTPSERKDGSVSKSRLSEFGRLVKTRPFFDRVWELSGTPSPGGLEDLWGPAYVLDFGERLGATKSRFLKRWFDYNKYTYQHTPEDFAEEEIMSKLQDVFFSLREEDYIDLPPLKVVDRYVRLGATEMARYRKLERELVLEDPCVEAANNGVLCNKLLQFANGSLYVEGDEDDPDAKSKAVRIHDAKLRELESIFEEAGGRPVLIAYSFKFDVEAIKKRFPWVRVFGETANDLRDWNAGRLRGMVLHPASAGHGLNFQRGGNIAVWYGLNWSLELYQQFNKRLHRRGQEQSTVWLYRILARGTADARVAEALEAKGTTQNRIVEHVRVRLEGVRAEAA